MQYPARDGRRQRQSSKWYVEVRVQGVPYKVPAFTDRAASLEFAKQLQRLADLAGSREQPTVELIAWTAPGAARGARDRACRTPGGR